MTILKRLNFNFAERHIPIRISFQRRSSSNVLSFLADLEEKNIEIGEEFTNPIFFFNPKALLRYDLVEREAELDLSLASSTLSSKILLPLEIGATISKHKESTLKSVAKDVVNEVLPKWIIPGTLHIKKREAVQNLLTEQITKHFLKNILFERKDVIDEETKKDIKGIRKSIPKQVKRIYVGFRGFQNFSYLNEYPVCWESQISWDDIELMKIRNRQMKINATLKISSTSGNASGYYLIPDSKFMKTELLLWKHRSLAEFEGHQIATHGPFASFMVNKFSLGSGIHVGWLFNIQTLGSFKLKVQIPDMSVSFEMEQPLK